MPAGSWAASSAASCADAGHDVSALVRRPGSAPPRTPRSGRRHHRRPGRAGSRRGRGRTGVRGPPGRGDRLAAGRRPHPRRSTSRARRRCWRRAAAAGSPRFVFASTVVTGDARGALLDEASALPVQTAYGRSKQEGERLVRESALPAVVLRPSHVYGPGGWFAEEFVERLRQAGAIRGDRQRAQPVGRRPRRGRGDRLPAGRRGRGRTARPTTWPTTSRSPSATSSG